MLTAEKKKKPHFKTCQLQYLRPFQLKIISFGLKSLVSESINAIQSLIPIKSASFLLLPKAASGFKGYFSILTVG